MKKTPTWTIGVIGWVGLILGLWSPVAEAEQLRLYGFVDTSFFYEHVNESNTFSLDQVELDIEAELTPWAGLRTDINFLAGDSDNTGLGAEDPFDELTTDEVLEQGYVFLTLPLPFDTTFRFGKFNAPIGWELLDPPDIYQFSNSLTFNFGIPTNLTGAALAMTFNPVFDLQIYVVNGWDQLRDNNNMKTFGGRLGITPMQGVNLGLSVITGPEQDDNDDDYRTVFDTDFTVQLIPMLLIGGEFNYGHEENAAVDGSNAHWLSGFMTLHYDFTDVIGLTFRGGAFYDDGGSRLLNDSGVEKQTAYALTLAPTFALAKGVGMLVEFRYDKSSQDVFLDDDGDFQDDIFSVAVEFTFVWERTLDILVKN